MFLDFDFEIEIKLKLHVSEVQKTTWNNSKKLEKHFKFRDLPLGPLTYFSFDDVFP
jgi:hypothetical protein